MPLGFKHSEASKRKIGKHGFHFGFLGKKHTQKWKDKMSERMKVTGSPWNIGIKRSSEYKRHLSMVAKQRGFGKWMTGRKLSEGIIQKGINTKRAKYNGAMIRNPKGFAKKMSEARMGADNPNWRGGVSKERYGEKWTESLKESIRIRDGYVCQICGVNQRKIEKRLVKRFRLSIHHVDYNKKNLAWTNLVSLCKNCHSVTNSNREQWKKYFGGQK